MTCSVERKGSNDSGLEQRAILKITKQPSHAT
jgi:hypothetical protein